MHENLSRQDESNNDEMDPGASKFFSGVVFSVVGLGFSATNYLEVQPTSRLGAYVGAVCISVGISKIVNGLTEPSAVSHTEEQ